MPTVTTVTKVDGNTADPATGNIITALPIFKSSTMLTDEQIKALPTTPVQLVPSPGPGMSIQAINGFALVDCTGGIYGNLVEDSYGVQFMLGDYAGATAAQDIPYLTDNSEPYYFGILPYLFFDAGVQRIKSRTDYLNLIANQPLKAVIVNSDLGNLTGGHPSNKMRIDIYYTIVDMAF